MADTRTTRGSAAWFGWVTFAAVLLCVLGVLNILEGLVALLRNQVTFIDGDSLVVVDLTGLGVVMVVFGALLLLSGIGLLARSNVARIAAIVIVALHALAQIASLGAYPVWSLLMLTLDVIVIFALTVHWEAAKAIPPPQPTAEATAVPGAPGAHRADRDQQAREPAYPMNQPPRTGPAHSAYDMPNPADRPHEADVQQVAPTSGAGPRDTRPR